MLRFGMLEEDELEIFSEEFVEAFLKAQSPMGMRHGSARDFKQDFKH